MNRNYFIAFVYWLLSTGCFGQTGRALLIGINDYYWKKNVLSDHSLKGCVNDAKSVKELIVSRFGFQKNNITDLYNAQATQYNILHEMIKLLARCNAGDNALIFYSGHGMLLDNSLSDDGKDQAILPSDVYQKSRSYILIRDLASIFNKFIDKKVTLTVIFDCCYSLSIAMDVEFEQEEFEEQDGKTRWVSFHEFSKKTSKLIDTTVYLYDSIHRTDNLAQFMSNEFDSGKEYEFNPTDSSYSLRLVDSLKGNKSIPFIDEDIKTAHPL